MNSKTTVGPFGGQGGDPWDDGINTGIRQIIILYGSVIDSIQIEYDKNGQSAWSVKHGGPGNKTVKVELDFPNEYLTSVSGYYTSYQSLVVIHSLIFQSNKRTYGPFGTKKGNHFSFSTSSTSEKIVGFHGRSGIFLDSIGAHMLVENYGVLSKGPFGGTGGDPWDDGINTGIKQIVLLYGSVIDSIHIEYDKNGQSVWSMKHGGPGNKTIKVELDFPNEYLTSVSGYYASYQSLVVIHSLTFQSNKRTYGPFGAKKGNHFSFSTSSTSEKIVGFHGRSGIFLDSIGAHMLVENSVVPSNGPFGGTGGNPWNDGVHTTVRQLIIAVGDLIDSICIEYDRNGQSVWSPKHGESDGGKKNTVKFDYPYEFLISISGYYHTYHGLGTVIQSLTFQTNKRTYGPFGTQKGRQFLIPTSNNGKIVGFHGRSGLYLDSIGAYVNLIPLHHYHSVGPYGGEGGTLWDDGVYTTVRQLIIAVGDIVDSIYIEYDKNGQSVWSSKHGKSNGGKKYTVKLDYPNEFLCSISGYYEKYFGMTLIHSLTFQTNKKIYGPFGAQKGSQFSTPSNGGKIVGFHGRSGSYLDSIGVHLSLEHFEMISNGPFGGEGGNRWNDGVNTTVRQLIVAVGDIVDSISIEYDKTGQSLWSTKHGESNGGEKYTVKLDYPNEFLISISGYYEKYFGMTLIQSLTFQTNKKIYGPFGAQKGCKFSIQSNDGKIVGFHGRSGSFLDSIGAYVEKIKPCI